MKPNNYIASFSLITALALAGCTPSAETEPVSTPTPSPIQTQASAPLPPPQPVLQNVRYENYLDGPQTPGDWSYQSGAARFVSPNGQTILTMRCLSGAGAIRLARPLKVAGNAQMTITTETVKRVHQTKQSDTEGRYLDLQSGYNLLDAMAITKGRIEIRTDAMPTLYLPAWPEITRVIEDCR